VEDAPPIVAGELLKNSVEQLWNSITVDEHIELEKRGRGKEKRGAG